MGRAAVVSSSTLAKYGRWGVEFYLGDPTADIARIKRTRARLQAEKESLKRARRDAHANRNKVRSLERTGEVRRIENS